MRKSSKKSALKSKKGKRKNPLKKYKYFLDQIYKVEANNTTPIARIEYYKTGKSSLDTERFTNTWELMLKDSDPEINKLAQDLVQYVYFGRMSIRLIIKKLIQRIKLSINSYIKCLKKLSLELLI